MTALRPLAVATSAALPEGFAKDASLFAALRARSIDPVPFVWDAPRPSSLDRAPVLLRSTWDYTEKPDAFSAFVDERSASVPFENRPEIVRWNRHKRYLDELARAGVPTVPTLSLERGSSRSLGEVFDSAAGTASRIVIKPAVSAGARETFVVDRAATDEDRARFSALIAAEDILVQPFLDGVLDEGEWSLLLCEGQPTHAVRKRAKPGDFRVQSEWGGSHRREEPPAGAWTLAQRALACAPSLPLYARVDLVPLDAGLACIELELIEPELFFDGAEEVADTYAAAVERRLFS